MKSIDKIMLVSAVFVMGALSESPSAEQRDNAKARPHQMQRRKAMFLLPTIRPQGLLTVPEDSKMQRRPAMFEFPALDNEEVMPAEMDSGPITSPLFDPTLHQKFNAAEGSLGRTSGLFRSTEPGEYVVWRIANTRHTEQSESTRTSTEDKDGSQRSSMSLLSQASEVPSADAAQIPPSNPLLFRGWTWSRGNAAPKSNTILGNGLLPKTRFNNWGPSSNKSSGLPEADKPTNHPLIHFLERVLSMRPAYYPSVQKISPKNT
jgi:hypothetical protein